MGLLGRLFGTGLPNVRSENLTAGRKHNMRTRVVRLQLITTGSIDHSMNLLADKVNTFRHALADLVKDALAHLDHIYDVNFAEALNFHDSSVVLLAARRGVESTLVQNNQVSLAFGLLVVRVGVDGDHFA